MFKLKNLSKKLPLVLLILVILYVVFYLLRDANVVNIPSLAQKTLAKLTGFGANMFDETPSTPEEQAAAIIDQGLDQGLDQGMYDTHNPNAFGTTLEEDRRITNDGVRKEYHNNPFPWAECTCASGNCDKHGVPEPTPGQTHVCKNGFPSKRIVDMHGGHFQLNHICAPSSPKGSCANEPAVLGRWWERCGCANPESVGLDVRPACTRC